MNSCNLPGILRAFLSPCDNPTANNSNREARAGMTRAELGQVHTERPEGQRDFAGYRPLLFISSSLSFLSWRPCSPR